MALRRNDVIWAFRHLLGRDPESEEIIQAYMRLNDPYSLQNILYNSPERRAAPFNIPQKAGQYCLWRPGRPQITIFGNCQAPMVACALSLLADVSVFGTDVMHYARDPDYFHREAENADILLSPIFRDNFGSLEYSKLKSSISGNVISFAPIYFSGVHPDIVYWGGMNNRIRSPIGDYHSAIILRSFIKGLNVDECLAAFSLETLEEMGFRGKAQRSLFETEARERAVDVKMLPLIEQSWRERRILLTINHPSSQFIWDMAKRFANHLGLKIRDVPSDLFYNQLQADTIWPVYKEVAELEGLKFHDPDIYIKLGYAITREELVRRCYIHYSGLDKDKFLALGTPDQLASVGLSQG